MVGKITWYNNKLGFGFVSPPHGGKRYYFETTQRELFALEQEIEFDAKENPKNGQMIAVNVKPVGSEKASSD